MKERRTPPGFRTRSSRYVTVDARRPRGGRINRELTDEEYEAVLRAADFFAQAIRFVFAAAAAGAEARAAALDPERYAAIARARRIRALADRPGTPHEGEAARRALARFLESHELTIADLDA